MIQPVKDSKMAFRILITLRGSKPRIWRRVLVPPSFSLLKVHQVIQAAMGWQECHLHEFIVGREHFGEPHPEYEMEMQDHARIRLEQALPQTGASMIYVYDFGDGWQHAVKLEAVVTTDDPLPVCLGGANACPPEDSGALFGYYDKLKIMADHKHPDHADIKAWMGPFDPAAFDLEAVNRRLRKLQNRRKA